MVTTLQKFNFGRPEHSLLEKSLSQAYVTSPDETNHGWPGGHPVGPFPHEGFPRWVFPDGPSHRRVSHIMVSYRKMSIEYYSI
jgi:hypothetical protein